MKTFKVITQTFMDENSEHFFWGAEEDISEIKRGDIMAIESKPQIIIKNRNINKRFNLIN